jgi:hypothetical protein
VYSSTKLEKRPEQVLPGSERLRGRERRQREREGAEGRGEK